jgi:hypothetical protein
VTYALAHAVVEFARTHCCHARNGIAIVSSIKKPTIDSFFIWIFSFDWLFFQKPLGRF